jgi:hypothetical protein
VLALHSEDAEARFLCTKEDTNYLAGAGIGMSNNRFLKRDESNSSRGHRVMQEWHAPCQGNGWPPSNHRTLNIGHQCSQRKGEVTRLPAGWPHNGQ